MILGDADGTGIFTVGGREHQSDWMHCCHCGKAHLIAASLNSLLQGKPVLGYCAKCDHPTCPDCLECVPIDRQLENIEAGRPELTPALVSAAFPHNPLT